MAKVTIPEVVERFQAYLDQNPAWGYLHIVLDDGNVDDEHVQFCVEDTQRHGDDEGHQLALLLLQMSKTQRLKLPTKCVY